MVAYLVKTSVEDYVGRPQDVPDKLNISSKVWAQFSRIVSTDDPDYGRKAKGGPGPLTSDEVHWIKYAGPLIIRRVLEHEAGADISRRITKDDLPKPSQQ